MSDKKLIFEGFHGDTKFPAIVCHNSSRNITDVVYLNCHRDFEFIYIEEGTLELKINLNQYILYEGEAAIINSNELHYGQADAGCECEQTGILFNLDMLKSEHMDICQTKYILPFIEGRYKFPNIIKGKNWWELEVLRHMKTLIAVYQQKGFGFELKFKAELCAIISEILLNNGFHTNEHRITSHKLYKIENLKKTLTYMEKNISHKILISELAKELNMSEDNYFKFFKSVTGNTPINYMNSYRIRMAETLLLNETLSVTQIAMEVGFDNISYFIKTFKNSKGLTPAKYRKEFSREIELKKQNREI